MSKITKISDIKTRKDAFEWAAAQQNNHFTALLKRLPEEVEVASGCSKLRPRDVRVGDIFFHCYLQHPCVVLSKAGEDQYWVVGLSTKEKVAIGTLNTRYEDTDYITASITKADSDTIRKNFRGSVSSQEVRRVKTLVKNNLPKF